MARPRHTRRAPAAVALFALLGMGGSCPFDTRDAVPPDVNEIPEACRFSSATQPGDVLRNLEAGFGCETFGVDLLRQSLLPAFDFEAAGNEDQSVRDFVDAWEDLAEPREGPVEQFSQHMGALGEGQQAELVLEADDGDESTAPEGFVFENVPYRLDVLDGAEAIAHFEGEADVFVRLEGTNYVAYRWVDIDQGFPTLARFWFAGTPAGQ